FEEAVSFMRGRIPMTKTEWTELVEPKLRFRAFTVARLAQCDLIEATRGRLITALEKGEGFASTWKDIKAIADADGAFQFRPGYWENVFRTNTQTAYTAGKLMQHQKNPPPAWQLLIVEDSRTSSICRGLIRDGKQSLALPSNHPFWEKFGYPPYHFQCRTGLQAVYKSQIGTDVQVENPTMKSFNKHFKPMEGFGGNPLDSGNYWMMTKGMFKRGLRYGIINEFNMLDNIVSDFNSLWPEYERKRFGKGWIDIHKDAFRSHEFKDNYAIAKKEAFNGDRLKMLPEHKGKNIKGWKNPDYLRNASLWELETAVGTKTSIDNAIRNGQSQAPNVIINVPKTADRTIVLKAIYGRFAHKNYPSRIRNLILYHGDVRNQWTADQIRGWTKP
ncbi:MAG: phage minor head protein, partial [Treponema sp.]|nr:phage minor head protein [Treponema sp.]